MESSLLVILPIGVDVSLNWTKKSTFVNEEKMNTSDEQRE